MANAYHNSSRNSSRNHNYSYNRPSLLTRLFAALPPELAAHMHSFFGRWGHSDTDTHTSRIPRSLKHAQRNWYPRRLLNIPHLFVFGWVLLLLWGERWVFQTAVEECRWENWERWPKDATPHHLVLLADPQLIDPHSYPGRPWPLSTLTIKHTDNYLKRSYISLQKKLHPDTVFFLGDLFDGGREWKTAKGNSADSAWTNGQRPSGEQALVKTWGKRYGEDFWLKEYDRFGKIFYNYWNAGGDDAGPWQRGRKVISSLPGNHDLGFGANVKIPIRDRFEVYFGQGNRVDVIGNHTFVSVDSVSLSAGGAPHDTTEITKPVDEFLSKVQATKRKAVTRELNFLAGNQVTARHVHGVEDLAKANFKNVPASDPGLGSADFPTILLTHVPLYRAPGTPCGPKRERWPPATPPKGQTGPVNPDQRNAISISRGWQYQNVLSEEDSNKLVSKIGNVVSVFSGDDHDYCEIVHPPSKNNAREITVKAMSWAMGVRKPGFLMLSMWNPIGLNGQPLYASPTGHGSSANQQSTTMESYLCLLPDQLGILTRYGIFLALTLTTLIVRAILMPKLNLTPFSASAYELEETLLPTTSRALKSRNPQEGEQSNASDHFSNSSTSSTSSNNSSNLAPRSTAARTRSVSPANNGYGLPASQVRYTTPPLVNQAGYYGNAEKWTKDNDSEEFGTRVGVDGTRDKRKDTVLRMIWREAWMSVWRTAWMVVCIYLYLVKFG